MTMTTGTTVQKGTMTTGTTTERPGVEKPRRGLISQVSVRTRITVVIALLTAAAMTGAGLLVYALESARIERAVNEQIDQEIAEFRTFAAEGRDPTTGEPFGDVGTLLELFLTRNVPDDDEMLVGYATDTPPARTRNRYGQEMLDEPAYLQAVEDSSEDGGTTTIDSERFGEVWVTVVPVRTSGTTGSLVLVNFLEDEHSELNGTLRTYALVALMSLGLITTIAAFQSGRLLAPLRTLEETARDITATDLSRRIPEQGNDDITALTRTINGMLERLDAGFTGQRRFLDDAGHELKTPLTIMRGHLELLDQGNATEIAETQELLLDEVDRMSRLVGDLIVLAKTRRPDFLAPSPVDVEPLTRALLAKARGLGDRDWRLDAAATGTVVLDEQRVTQAVLQLADNAVKHTDPGATIAIGSTIDPGHGGTLTLWVRDTGPGVPPHQRAAIFERFGRGTVRPGDEGFGLGLSIVDAIAQAHGGTVAVTDADPAGTPPGARFELTLPTEEVTAPWPRS